jgi:alkanesulfonate monooxygenase SsuD/methylene tetrahydromethanopterin reductase-like flavin-dependent oxidoreductase (luciferase family)
MERGIGLDGRLGLGFPELRQLAIESAAAGYTSIWTPAGATGRDAFHVCHDWLDASHRLTAGTSVVPVPAWTAATLAAQAATVAERSGDRFILGIGPGSIADPDTRAAFGLPPTPPLTLMRDWLIVLRQLFGGERVDYDGQLVSLHGVSLGFDPPRRVPLYLAAMGPRMLRLAGELAEGAMPNWASAHQLAWCRARIAEGAARAGRPASAVTLAQYIRVCIDEDVAAARRAFAMQVLSYAMVRKGGDRSLGYRAHFARMGFEALLTELEARRDAGARLADLTDDVPDDLLLQVGYFGPPGGARAAFARLATPLDVAIVRVITTRPDIDKVRLALRTLSPTPG